MTLKEFLAETIKRAASSVGKRLLIAVPFVVLMACVVAVARKSESEAAALIAAVACFLILAVFVGVNVAPGIGEFFGSRFCGWLYPTDRFNRPQPMYGVPAAQRARGLYEEAIAGYEKIAEDYPGEVKPYIEMIDIAVVNLEDRDMAKAILYRGLDVLKREQDRKVLSRAAKSIISRLDPEPDWVIEQDQRHFTPPDLSDQGPVAEPDGVSARRYHAGARGRYEGDDPA